jgi:hypothetical protein
VDRLDALIRTFEPTAPVDKHGWLFEERALDAFVNDDRHERQRTLDEAQAAALSEIIADIGFDGLLDWAATRPNQQFSALQIGETLAHAGHDSAEVLVRVASEREMDRRIALQYVSRMTYAHGLAWAEDALDRYGSAWSPEQQALFLRALPASPEVWTLAESLGRETDRLYWANAHPYSLPTDGENSRLAAKKLMAAGQPRVALDLLSMVAHQEPDEVPGELLAHALEEATRTAITPFDSTLVHNIGEHLDRLDDAGFDPDRLARLEWAYLPLFRFEKRQSRVLHRALAEDPAFFVQVVSLVFRAHGEEPIELSELETAQARSAQDLLDSWRRVPGTRSDGTVDAESLAAWVHDARKRLADANRVDTGERSMGRVLRYGPAPERTPNADDPARADDDGLQEPSHVNWPAAPIRDLIESCASEHIETGFEREVYNSRGVTMRALTEGGRQERELAGRYRRYAAFAGMRWPRTAAMLVRIAESYEREAERHDGDADLTEDTWR